MMLYILYAVEVSMLTDEVWGRNYYSHNICSNYVNSQTPLATKALQIE